MKFLGAGASDHYMKLRAQSGFGAPLPGGACLRVVSEYKHPGSVTAMNGSIAPYVTQRASSSPSSYAPIARK
eukprot:5209315-Pyramimonas_sp.AAC.1